MADKQEGGRIESYTAGRLMALELMVAEIVRVLPAPQRKVFEETVSLMEGAVDREVGQRAFADNPNLRTGYLQALQGIRNYLSHHPNKQQD